MTISTILLFLILIYWLSREETYELRITPADFKSDESHPFPYLVIYKKQHNIINPKFANELNIMMFFNWEYLKNGDIIIYQKRNIHRFNIILKGFKKWNVL